MGGRSRPSPYPVGLKKSDRPQAFRRAFAAARIAHDFEGNLLAFLEAAEAGTLHRRNMDEDVLSTIVRLDEAVTLGAIEPFHCASGHINLPSWRCRATTRCEASS